MSVSALFEFKGLLDVSFGMEWSDMIWNSMKTISINAWYSHSLNWISCLSDSFAWSPKDAWNTSKWCRRDVIQDFRKSKSRNLIQYQNTWVVAGWKCFDLYQFRWNSKSQSSLTVNWVKVFYMYSHQEFLKNFNYKRTLKSPIEAIWKLCHKSYQRSAKWPRFFSLRGTLNISQ